MYTLISCAETYWMFMYTLFTSALIYWMSLCTVFSSAETYWMFMYMLFSSAVTYRKFMYTLLNCAVTIFRPIVQHSINEWRTRNAAPDSMNVGQFLCWPNDHHFARKKSAPCSSSHYHHLSCLVLFQIPISALKSVNELLNTKNQGEKYPVHH